MRKHSRKPVTYDEHYGTSSQLQQLNAIAANTKANADAAIKIQKSSTVIQNALSSVITQGKSGKAIRIQ